MNLAPTALTVCLAALAGGAQAQAVIAPFTETFETSSANFLGNDFSPLEHLTTGGVDGSTFVRAVVPTDTAAGMGLVVARAETDPHNPANNASGGALFGDYIESGITALSFDVRHDAGTDIGFNVRFSPPNRFPGAFAIASQTVASGTEFTTVTLDLSSLATVAFEGPSTPDNFETVFGNVGNVQIFLTTDLAAAGTSPVNFDFDNVSIGTVPEPTSLALLATGGLLLTRRRRARA